MDLQAPNTNYFQGPSYQGHTVAPVCMAKAKKPSVEAELGQVCSTLIPPPRWAWRWAWNQKIGRKWNSSFRITLRISQILNLRGDLIKTFLFFHHFCRRLYKISWLILLTGGEWGKVWAKREGKVYQSRKLKKVPEHPKCRPFLSPREI